MDWHVQRRKKEEFDQLNDLKEGPVARNELSQKIMAEGQQGTDRGSHGPCTNLRFIPKDNGKA